MRFIAFIAAATVGFATDVEFFEKKIRPVLIERCYGCHSASAKNPMGGLMVDSGQGLQRGGASGQSAVIANSPEKKPVDGRDQT